MLMRLCVVLNVSFLFVLQTALRCFEYKCYLVAKNSSRCDLADPFKK